MIDAVITELYDEEVTMDDNNELAGKRLTFEITLLSNLSDPSESKEEN
ncbi:MAG: hypothetical protein JJV91_02070 [Desulfosarcina sp.]|nr:hypothetical protein [Desulfobacterales bacterium]